jgi:hypothetical protein
MARPQGRWQYVEGQGAVDDPDAPPKDEPKPADDDEKPEQGGKPASMPTQPQRASAPKGT